MEPLCKPSALIQSWFVNELNLFRVVGRVMVERSEGFFFDNRFPRPAKRASDFSVVKIIRQIGPGSPQKFYRLNADFGII